MLLDNAEAILAKLAKKGLILGNWYRQVVAPVGLDLKKMQYVTGSCPLAEKFSQQVINLPLNISPNQATTIVEALKNV